MTSFIIAIRKNVIAIGKDIESNALYNVLAVVYIVLFAVVGDVVNNVIAIPIKVFQILYPTLNIVSVISCITFAFYVNAVTNAEMPIMIPPATIV